MKTIKYRNKKLRLSDDDWQGIVYAKSVGLSEVDVQQPAGKGQFEVVWLNTEEIHEA